MKSTRIKALITILIFTLSSCSNLLRKSEETYESLLENYSQAQVTADAGTWNDGFNCPSIFLSKNGAGYFEQGPARIQGLKFVDAKNGENREGLVLDFVNKFVPTQDFPNISRIISGKKYYIPWRNIKSNFKFTDPTLNNKYIEGNILTDGNVSYQLKIVFPFAYFSTPVTNDNGNAIEKRINDQSVQIRNTIRISKEVINRTFPEYKNAKENIMRLNEGTASIDKQIVAINKQIKIVIKENDDRKKTFVMLSAQSDKQSISVEALKNQIDKTNEEIIQNNANIKAMTKSIDTLNKSKADPKAQLAKATKDSDDVLKVAVTKFNELNSLAPEMVNQIKLSKQGFEGLKHNIFQNNINDIVA